MGRRPPEPAHRTGSEGCAAARGDALVHFVLNPHNILLTPAEVVIVDWPHARLGGLQDPTPGLEPITRTKLRIGLGALAWLQRRLTGARG